MYSEGDRAQAPELSGGERRHPAAHLIGTVVDPAGQAEARHAVESAPHGGVASGALAQAEIARQGAEFELIAMWIALESGHEAAHQPRRARTDDGHVAELEIRMPWIKTERVAHRVTKCLDTDVH